ncbi:PGBD4-like protein, partial [Mya arenaria]
PVDYLELFLDEDLINHLCIQTNLYAEQYQAVTSLKRFSRVHDWTNIRNDEMKQFLAIVLLIGIVNLPTMDNKDFVQCAVYEPRRDNCVDESLLLWKGRLLFRQYIPHKRARFKVNAGKDDPENEIRPVIPDNALNLSTSEQMVVFLIAPLLDKGYHVHTDNWYTSTIRANRGIPTQLTEQAVDRTGDSSALLGDDKIVATKYHSTKVVYLLPSVHGHDEVTVNNSRRNAQSNAQRYRQNITEIWGASTGRIKLSNLSALNAFILACKDGYDKPFLQFLESVITSWAYKDNRPPVVSEPEDIVRLRERHFLEIIPPNEGEERPTRLCKVCSKKGLKRREVRHYCPDCPSKPALCYSPCFRAYHTKFVYWQ